MQNSSSMQTPSASPSHTSILLSSPPPSLIPPRSSYCTMTTSSSISTSRPVELLIAGQSVLSPTTFTVLSSHSQLPVGTSSHATLAHVDAALESAAASFESWEAVSVGKKREIFLRAAEVLESPEWSDKIRVAMREEISAAPGTYSLPFSVIIGLMEGR
jgi:hypothetical protein